MQLISLFSASSTRGKLLAKVQFPRNHAGIFFGIMENEEILRRREAELRFRNALGSHVESSAEARRLLLDGLATLTSNQPLSAPEIKSTTSSRPSPTRIEALEIAKEMERSGMKVKVVQEANGTALIPLNKKVNVRQRDSRP